MIPAISGSNWSCKATENLIYLNIPWRLNSCSAIGSTKLALKSSKRPVHSKIWILRWSFGVFRRESTVYAKWQKASLNTYQLCLKSSTIALVCAQFTHLLWICNSERSLREFTKKIPRKHLKKKKTVENRKMNKNKVSQKVVKIRQKKKKDLQKVSLRKDLSSVGNNSIKRCNLNGILRRCSGFFRTKMAKFHIIWTLLKSSNFIMDLSAAWFNHMKKCWQAITPMLHDVCLKNRKRNLELNCRDPRWFYPKKPNNKPQKQTFNSNIYIKPWSKTCQITRNQKMSSDV